MDNDAAPTISSVSTAVDASGEAVDEGEGAVFTVSLSNESTSAQTYSFSLSKRHSGQRRLRHRPIERDVQQWRDLRCGYRPDHGTSGVTEFTATVATIDDTIDEANETFTLTVGGVEGTATIVDNDAAPTISSVSTAVDASGEA